MAHVVLMFFSESGVVELKAAVLFSSSRTICFLFLQRYFSSLISSFCCTAVLLYYSIAILLYCCIAVLLYCCTAVSLYCSCCLIFLYHVDGC